jgi:hypothetical protein
MLLVQEKKIVHRIQFRPYFSLTLQRRVQTDTQRCKVTQKYGGNEHDHDIRDLSVWAFFSDILGLIPGIPTVRVIFVRRNRKIPRQYLNYTTMGSSQILSSSSLMSHSHFYHIFLQSNVSESSSIPFFRRENKIRNPTPHSARCEQHTVHGVNSIPCTV